MKKYLYWIVFALLISIWASCFSFPPTPLRETIKANPRYISNVQEIFVNPLPVSLKLTDNQGELTLQAMQMISKTEIILFYNGNYDKAARKYIRNEIYISDAGTGSIRQVSEDEKSLLQEYRSNIKNFRVIPPTTGKMVLESLAAAFGTDMDSSESTFEVCSFDRSLTILFHGYEFSKRKTSTSSPEFNCSLSYDLDGREMRIKYYERIPLMNANLSPNGNYMTLGYNILNLIQGTREPLLEPRQIRIFSIDPSWSRAAILYDDIDPNTGGLRPYIGICSINIE